MWMNESEIDQALEVVGRNKPRFLPYVKFLSDWCHIVNQNSDGWPYWKAGAQAASKLMEGVERIMGSIRGRHTSEPSTRDLDRALTSIKTFAVKHKLPAPTIGGEEAPSSGTSALYHVGWLDSNGDHAYFLELTDDEVSRVKSELQDLQGLKHLHEYHVDKVVPQMGFTGFITELGQLFG